MSATDKLRRMLDERGVRYLKDDGESIRATKWKARKQGAFLEHAMFVEYANGETDFTFPSSAVTPEQAIAATLGGGKLTAKQVRKCVRVGACDHGLWGAIDEDTDWQTIADELNAALENEECDIVKSYGKHPITNDEVVLYNCSKCGKLIDLSANYCGKCGARIRKTVKR